MLVRVTHLPLVVPRRASAGVGPGGWVRRPAATAAAGAAVVCVIGALVVVAAEVAIAGVPRPPLLDVAAWASAVPGAALVVAGALLAQRVSRQPMTWLLLAGGLLTVASGWALAYAAVSVLRHGGTWPATAAAVQFGARSGPLLNLVPPLVLLLFPDGRLPSRAWRVPVVLSLAMSSSACAVLTFAPWRLLQVPAPGVADTPLPLPIPDGAWTALLALAPLLIATSPVVPALAFLARFRAADPQRQAQLRWMLLAALTNLLLMVVPAVAGAGWAADVAFVLSTVALAAAVLVAVTRYRLYDIDLLFGRVLVYGALVAAVVALDLTVFVGTGTVLGDPVAAVVGAAVVAVVYAPLRGRIERLVARVGPGRLEPYTVVSDLADRLERADDRATQLDAVARTVATAVGSPYVRVELDSPCTVAEHGSPGPAPVTLPFTYRDDPIGRLVLVPPVVAPPRSRQRLLADVVRQAAAAVRLGAVSDELLRSREALVTQVAEERRRLRRDLHDGLGPTLAAVALKVQAAANLVDRDLPSAQRTLARISDDLATVLDHVRSLAHDLRPPALDQLGLAGALHRLTDRFATGPAFDLDITGLPAQLPAAVEEAVFHIVGEAVSNAVRHARATRVRVVVSHDGATGTLEVTVTDDGTGLAPGRAAGVGLTSLRERSEELGGRCSVGDAPGGGTRVQVVLPRVTARRPAPETTP